MFSDQEWQQFLDQPDVTIETDDPDHPNTLIVTIPVCGDCRLGRRLWLDASRNLALTKMEWLGDRQTVLTTFQPDRLQQVAPGIWFPFSVRVSSTTFRKDIEVPRLTLNQNVDDSLFTQKTPWLNTLWHR